MRTPDEFNRLGQGHLPAHLGIVITRSEPDAMQAELPLRAELMAPNGFLHAGSLVTLADNAITFLLMWEGMSLSSYFLVITEANEEDTLRAGRLWLRAQSARGCNGLHHDRAEVQPHGHRARGHRALRGATGAPGPHDSGLGRHRQLARIGPHACAVSLHADAAVPEVALGPRTINAELGPIRSLQERQTGCRDGPLAGSVNLSGRCTRFSANAPGTADECVSNLLQDVDLDPTWWQSASGQTSPSPASRHV